MQKERNLWNRTRLENITLEPKSKQYLEFNRFVRGFFIWNGIGWGIVMGSCLVVGNVVEYLSSNNQQNIMDSTYVHRASIYRSLPH